MIFNDHNDIVNDILFLLNWTYLEDSFHNIFLGININMLMMLMMMLMIMMMKLIIHHQHGLIANRRENISI